jgi:secreted Zn-dependent insulinase-like peptidase
MLFMGSDKYPDENMYDSFVESRGGYCNAMTEGEYTTYQFEVESTYFAETLDIFAHCFISPKMAPHSVKKEIRAIESEFQLALMSDGSRRQEVFCSCCRDGHFFRKFR